MLIWESAQALNLGVCPGSVLESEPTWDCMMTLLIMSCCKLLSPDV